MGRMSRFLRIFVFLPVLFFASNVMAAGYVCEELVEYTACEPGYYMTLNGEFNATPDAGNDCSVCPVGFACSGGVADKTECPAGSFTGAVGATTCSTCPSVASEYAQYVDKYETDLSLGEGIMACRVILKNIPANNGDGVLTEIPCYITSADSATYDMCEQTDVNALRCDGGYYGGASVFERTNCSFDANGVETCGEKLVAGFAFSGVADAVSALKSGQYCVQVGAGYYSANGSLDIFKCPDGETTIGFGTGADEAGDCGVIMHVGDANLYLRSDKKTSAPALNVLRGGKRYYANMSVTDVSLSYGSDKKLRILSEGVPYWVHDESVGVTSEQAACEEIGAQWIENRCDCGDKYWFYHPELDAVGCFEQDYEAEYMQCPDDWIVDGMKCGLSTNPV